MCKLARDVIERVFWAGFLWRSFPKCINRKPAVTEFKRCAGFPGMESKSVFEHWIIWVGTKSQDIFLSTLLKIFLLWVSKLYRSLDYTFLEEKVQGLLVCFHIIRSSSSKLKVTERLRNFLCNLRFLLFSFVKRSCNYTHFFCCSKPGISNLCLACEVIK